MRRVRMGSWLTRPDLGITETFARFSQFDWLTIDMEHSPITTEQAESQIRVIQSFGKEAFVRLPSNDAPLIAKVLDLGANGIIVPRVNSAADAQQAVAAAFYPPRGQRGVGLSRAQLYKPEGLDPYRAGVHADIKVIVQIEQKEAIASLDAIFGTQGLHGFFIGPYDLSASFGKPGDFDCLEMRDAVTATMLAGKLAGLAAGIHVVEPDRHQVQMRIDQGFDFIALSFDMLLLIRSLERELQ